MQRVFVLAALLACASSEQTTPITRVVELLQHLSEEVEKEGKKEEDAYGKFVCWGKGLVNEKILSNNAAESRIEMLNQYIADLDAGRIELTTERVDLEKELETIHGDMEVASDIRKKEKADFALASEEMQQGIDALTEAIEVLKTATAGSQPKPTLLGLRGKMQQRAQVTESAGLTRAVSLGRKILTKSDALFLQRLLTGEVPTWNWKKLNRKADFKMNYKARSVKIQDVLSSLLQTFQDNLNESGAKEKKAQETFDNLMGGKEAQKQAAQEALGKLESEGGAKGMSKAQSEEEVALLTKQVTDDKKYIADLEKALSDKKAEWKDRQTLRAGELAAISKAIAILHSDDARDTFKRSFKSQGYSLLQESTSSSARRTAVVQMLRTVGHSTSDERMMVLAASVATSSGPFDDVVAAIVKMLARLEQEETDDLEKKEQCETDRATDTRDAVVTSRTIDENTQLMNRLTSEIADLEQEIAVTEDKIEKVRAEREEAIKQRAEEKKAYDIAKQDDIDAAALVEEATSVMKTFYKDNMGKDLGLAQKSQRQQQPGQAPPPPPATWEAPYGGKEMESHGILSVLSMIHDDIKADEAKGDQIETDAIKVFLKTKTDLDSAENRLLKLKTTLEGTKGDKQKEKGDTKTSRTASKQQLDIVMKKIKDAEKGCHYFTINYPLRLHNRQIEMDGLRKAKAVLEGARFDAPDPNREIKPGDAFMQQVKKH